MQVCFCPWRGREAKSRRRVAGCWLVLFAGSFAGHVQSREGRGQSGKRKMCVAAFDFGEQKPWFWQHVVAAISRKAKYKTSRSGGLAKNGSLAYCLTVTARTTTMVSCERGSAGKTQPIQVTYQVLVDSSLKSKGNSTSTGFRFLFFCRYYERSLFVS